MENYTFEIVINRSASEVFAAVVDPTTICKYFADAASGGLIQGNRVVWHWEQWGDFPVNVVEVTTDSLVNMEFDTLEWKKTEPDAESSTISVKLKFEPIDSNKTKLSIGESGWRVDSVGLKGSHENCSGWTHFAMCLKAYLEHGINLRN